MEHLKPSQRWHIIRPGVWVCLAVRCRFWKTGQNRTHTPGGTMSPLTWRRDRPHKGTEFWIHIFISRVNPHKALVLSVHVGPRCVPLERGSKSHFAHGESPADGIRHDCYIGSIWTPAISDGNPSESQRYMNYTDSDQWCKVCFVFLKAPRSHLGPWHHVSRAGKQGSPDR